MQQECLCVVCCIDFKKGFDGVWRAAVWRVMTFVGYKDKIVRILEALYEGTVSDVRPTGKWKLIEWFETAVSVLQGFVLSHLL